MDQPVHDIELNLRQAGAYIDFAPDTFTLWKCKSQRKIPLVGYALDAFKACPNGFTNYHDRPDSLSGLLSKYLSERSDAH